MIVCGWCNAETNPGCCSACGRNPLLPWEQRGQEPPKVTETTRRGRLLALAERAIRQRGFEPTTDLLADELGITSRNVRRWRADVRAAT